MSEIIVPFQTRVRSEFGVKIIRPDGRVRLQRQIPNMFLNSGLDYLCGAGGSNGGQAIVVGDGSSTPAPAQTQLDSLVATASGGSSPYYQSFVSPEPPYFGRGRVVRQFSVGAAAGNLTELGLCNGENQTTFPLIARALILDSSGNPTAMPVLEDEILQVTHDTFQYFPGVDEEGNPVDITGTVIIGGESYDYTLRPTLIATLNQQGGRAVLTPLGSQTFQGGAVAHAMPTQILGPVTGRPDSSGQQTVAGTAVSLGAYTTGTYNRNFTITANINQFNVAGGIGSIMFATSRGSYQVSFDPVIPKDNEKVFSITFNFSVARL